MPWRMRIPGFQASQGSHRGSVEPTQMPNRVMTAPPGWRLAGGRWQGYRTRRYPSDGRPKLHLRSTLPVHRKGNSCRGVLVAGNLAAFSGAEQATWALEAAFWQAVPMDSETARNRVIGSFLSNLRARVRSSPTGAPTDTDDLRSKNAMAGTGYASGAGELSRRDPAWSDLFAEAVRS